MVGFALIIPGGTVYCVKRVLIRAFVILNNGMKSLGLFNSSLDPDYIGSARCIRAGLYGWWRGERGGRGD